MSCNQCASKFGLFRKELGCSSCGQVFCSDCLKNKCAVPRKGPEKQHVCKKCYLKITTGETEQPLPYQPPDAYLKRLEQLESTAAQHPYLAPDAYMKLLQLDNPAAPPITVYKHDPRIVHLRTGLSKVDQDLVDRLEKLKRENSSPPPSESEIRQRLDKLIKSGSSESADGGGQQEEPTPPEEADSEGEVDKLTRKLVEEVGLDQRCAVGTGGKEKEEAVDEEEEELPWCVLCNEDAKVRCVDCDGSLYCQKCNVDVHKEFDYDHKWVAYKGKKSEGDVDESDEE